MISRAGNRRCRGARGRPQAHGRRARRRLKLDLPGEDGGRGIDVSGQVLRPHRESMGAVPQAGVGLGRDARLECGSVQTALEGEAPRFRSRIRPLKREPRGPRHSLDGWAARDSGGGARPCPRVPAGPRLSVGSSAPEYRDSSESPGTRQAQALRRSSRRIRSRRASPSGMDKSWFDAGCHRRARNT